MRETDSKQLAALEDELRTPIRKAAPPFDNALMAETRATIAQRASASRAGARPARGGAWSSRKIAIVASCVAVVAVLAVVPALMNNDPRAFAAEKAAAALLPQTEALHFIETITYESPVAEREPSLVEQWIAPGGKNRKSTRTPSGEPVHESITQGKGGRIRSGTYADGSRALGELDDSDVAVPTSTLAPGAFLTVTDEPSGILGPAEPEVDVRWWLELRDDLMSGKAKIVGTEEIGGARYWRVRSQDATFMPSRSIVKIGSKWVEQQDDDPSASKTKRTVEALLHEGDYRPLRAAITVVEIAGDTGYEDEPQAPEYMTFETRFEVHSWETVPLSEVPRGTFDLESIPLAGAWLVMQRLLPTDLPGFREFGAWGLTEDWQYAGETTLENETFAYHRGPTLPGDESADLTNIPPPGFPSLSDRYVSGLYSGSRISAFVASMPRASEASRTAFLDAKRAHGRPVTGTVNGLRYRGIDAFDSQSATGNGGVALVDTDDETLVIAYTTIAGNFSSSPLEQVIGSVERKNP